MNLDPANFIDDKGAFICNYIYIYPGKKNNLRYIPIQYLDIVCPKY